MLLSVPSIAMLWAQPVATEAGQPGQNSYAPGALEPPKVYPYAFITTRLYIKLSSLYTDYR